MIDNISIDNLKLIYNFKQYFAKVINNLSEDEKEMFIKIIERLRNAEY